MLVIKNLIALLDGSIYIKKIEKSNVYQLVLPLEIDCNTKIISKENYKVILISKSDYEIYNISNICNRYKYDFKYYDDFNKMENEFDNKTFILLDCNTEDESFGNMFNYLINKTDNVYVLGFNSNNFYRYKTILKPIIGTELISIFNKQFLYAEKKDLDLTGKRILVVEDNKINRELASEIISSTKADIEFAENGLIAYEKVNTHIVGYYDLIFMDLQMPVMDGFDSTKKIRAINRKDVKRIPIVALTASTYPNDIIKIKDFGMNDYIVKPIDINELYIILRMYLNK